jgi:hypothetical protein
MGEVLSEAGSSALLTILENRKYYFVLYKGNVYPFHKGLLNLPEIAGSERKAFPLMTEGFLTEEFRSELKAIEPSVLLHIQNKHGRLQYVCDVSTVSTKGKESNHV